MDTPNYIRHLDGNDVDFVAEIIAKHTEWYGDCEIKDFLHADFYGVYSKDNELLGFFALCHFGYGIECLLACVYVKEEYRKKGIFSKMVKFAKKTAYDCPLITIGAKKDNELANKIYSKMFTFSHYDETEDGNYYFIKDTR